MTIAWPDNLVSDLARRRAVLVIGAGVSRHSRDRDGRKPPLWREFLSDSLRSVGVEGNEHISEAISKGDLLHACEWLKKQFQERWVRHLRRAFLDPMYGPAEIHNAIIALDQRIMFTLNFDDIIERAAQAVGQNAYVQKRYCDADISEIFRGDGRYLVKVHGSLNNPNDLIFTQGEYAKARISHQDFYMVFDAALQTHTFLFLGCGTSDPDISLLLENQAFRRTGATDSPHYFLASRGLNEDLVSSLWLNRNLKVIEFDPIDDEYSGLVSGLRDLGQMVDRERDKLMTTMNW